MASTDSNGNTTSTADNSNNNNDNSNNNNSSNNNKSSTSSSTDKLTQADIETKLKASFTGINDSNVTILAHYLYKNPKKWRSDDANFVADVNKLIPEAYAHNMKPSNALFGALIAIFIILICGLLWWVITMFVKRNNTNVLNDPSVVNPAFI